MAYGRASVRDDARRAWEVVRGAVGRKKHSICSRGKKRRSRRAHRLLPLRELGLRRRRRRLRDRLLFVHGEHVRRVAGKPACVEGGGGGEREEEEGGRQTLAPGSIDGSGESKTRRTTRVKSFVSVRATGRSSDARTNPDESQRRRGARLPARMKRSRTRDRSTDDDAHFSSAAFSIVTSSSGGTKSSHSMPSCE